MKSFFLTMLAVMAAEMFDKTQLILLGMVKSAKSPKLAYTGAVVGFMLASTAALLIRNYLVKIIPEGTLDKVIGTLFIIVGGYMLWRR